jgi:hypothetical protein
MVAMILSDTITTAVTVLCLVVLFLCTPKT